MSTVRSRRRPRKAAEAAPLPVGFGDPLAEWLTPQQYAERYPQIASVDAVRGAIQRRAQNGLLDADAVRLVGKRFLVHRVRFTEVRLGER